MPKYLLINREQGKPRNSFQVTASNYLINGEAANIGRERMNSQKTNNSKLNEDQYNNSSSESRRNTSSLSNCDAFTFAVGKSRFTEMSSFSGQVQSSEALQAIHKVEEDCLREKSH